MIIKFKLEDYEDICDEYESVFENEDVVDVINGDDLLITRTRRIVIPELQASFREAEWYARNEDVEDPDDEDAWEIQCSVFVQYEEDEQNPEKYISFASSDLAYYASELLGEHGNGYEKVSQLECYIDTKEFLEENEDD
jgi:hypothetical protein